MAGVRLKSLEIEALGPFRDKQVLQFPSRGCVLLRGRNLDTGGGSGTGKSVLLSAVDIALEYGATSMTELQCWHTDKPLRLRLGMESTHLITVGRGGKASLVVGADKPVHGAKAITEGLFKELGMPPAVLEALTVRRQRSPGGNFLSRANAGLQEFLALILDLKKYEQQLADSEAKQETLESQLKLWRENQRVLQVHQDQLLKFPVHLPDFAYQQELEREIAEAQAELQVLRTELGVKESVCLTMRNQQAAWDQKRRLDLAVQNAEFERRRQLTREQVLLPAYDESRVDGLRAVLLQAQNFYVAAETEFLEAQTAYEKERARILGVIQEYQRLVDAAPEEKRQIEVLKAKLKLVESQLCPTCRQSWVTESLQQERESLMVQLVKLQFNVSMVYEKAIADCRKTLESLVRPSSEKVENFKAIIAEQQRAISADRLSYDVELSRVQAALQQQLRGLTEEQQEVEREHYRAQNSWDLAGDFAVLDADCTTMKLKVSGLEQKLETLGRNLSHAQLQIQEAQQRYKAYEHELHLAEEQLQASEAALAPIEADVRAEKDFQTLIGREGFLGKIFEETLQAISDETNAILASVPNTSAVELRFETETETQKGTITRKIRPVVTVLGHESTLKGPACSGGMKSVVELACDLAVRNVVCQRLGVTPCWLILDEPMEGLGNVEKEAVLEILQRQAQDCLVLVVDHGTEFKAFFTEVIEVQYRAGVSTLTSGPMLSNQ